MYSLTASPDSGSLSFILRDVDVPLWMLSEKGLRVMKRMRATKKTQTRRRRSRKTKHREVSAQTTETGLDLSRVRQLQLQQSRKGRRRPWMKNIWAFEKQGSNHRGFCSDVQSKNASPEHNLFTCGGSLPKNVSSELLIALNGLKLIVLLRVCLIKKVCKTRRYSQEDPPCDGTMNLSRRLKVNGGHVIRRPHCLQITWRSGSVLK